MVDATCFGLQLWPYATTVEFGQSKLVLKIRFANRLMSTFYIHKNPHDGGRPPRRIEVALCLADHAVMDNGSHAVTPLCCSEEGVEFYFERVISEIRRKKSEACAILRKSAEARKK